MAEVFFSSLITTFNYFELHWKIFPNPAQDRHQFLKLGQWLAAPPTAEVHRGSRLPPFLPKRRVPGSAYCELLNFSMELLLFSLFCSRWIVIESLAPKNQLQFYLFSSSGMVHNRCLMICLSGVSSSMIDAWLLAVEIKAWKLTQTNWVYAVVGFQPCPGTVGYFSDRDCLNSTVMDNHGAWFLLPPTASSCLVAWSPMSELWRRLCFI